MLDIRFSLVTYEFITPIRLALIVSFSYYIIAVHINHNEDVPSITHSLELKNESNMNIACGEGLEMDRERESDA